ncbi:MAG: DUF3558 domain-containing protein [Anaerolineales bacterium]|nr:DUF3558 domain-containing protein [Anaerolineales bacterium]
MKQITSFITLLAILLLTLTSCNLSSPSGPSPALDEPVSVNTQVSDTPSVVENIPVARQVEISELDPCKLVTKESAEAALGQSVDEPIVVDDATVRSCMYNAVPGEKLISVSVYTGGNAKNNLLNEIAQLQNGCNLSFKGSTKPQTPTPFPPEVEALKIESILDLYLRDLEIQKGCGGSYAQLADLGDNAYTFQSFIVGTVIGVATDDVLVYFVIGDISMTPEQTLEAAKGLVKRATSP